MLECRSLSVRFDDLLALDGVDLDLVPGRRLAVVGPSGCGKSTLLRTIAGLVPQASGTIAWNDDDFTNRPPHERRIGLMFQEHALFPHRDVAANVAFGLRMQRRSPEFIAGRVDELLTLVGLGDRRSSTIDELSGGERQRVALARTLAPEPQLVMLDEPLASLDRVLRTDLLDEISAIFGQLDITAIAVTHDLDEAFRFGDDLAVMSPGRIERIGPIDDVWNDPRTEFTARFLGYSPVTATEPTPTGLVTPWGRVDGAVSASPTLLLAAGPDAFAVDPGGTIPARVLRSTFERGLWRHVMVLSDGSEVVVTTATRHCDEVVLRLDGDAVRFVQPTSSAV
jgi:thiamine transport system ATP-binding protein